MELHELQPDQKNRMLAEIKQDEAYAKSRNLMLIVSVVCTAVLALVGLLMMRDSVTMEVAGAIIGVCIIAYFYCIIRVVKTRNTAEARWILKQSDKSAKKKRRK
jgi:hypothetical protein